MSTTVRTMAPRKRIALIAHDNRNFVLSSPLMEAEYERPIWDTKDA